MKKEKCPGQFFVHGCHGNAEIHMRTKFHFHALRAWFASLRSEEVVIEKKCLRPFFVHGCHGNAEIHMRTKFHLHTLYVVQV